jgi:hypothetical protein
MFTMFDLNYSQVASFSETSVSRELSPLFRKLSGGVIVLDLSSYTTQCAADHTEFQFTI